MEAIIKLQFIAFLKKYKGKICLLQNGYTISNAEQFIIDLKDNKNVTTLGETTKGTITYGSNVSKTLTLPSKRFLFYPTDMNGRAKDLAYESIGIKPDVALDAFSEDWITQTLNYIKKNQP
jgi:C-terminal processing protease CtpA/Prc